MRVLFLTLYPEAAASPRYRVGQFLPHLRAEGLDCTVASAVTPDQYGRLTGPGRRVRPFWYHAAESPRRLMQIMGSRGFDVVFVQKAIMTAYVRGFLGLLRRRARRIVYDFDDAVHLAPPHPLRAPWRILEEREQVSELIRCANLVLAGNSWLAQESKNPNTVVFPTVVDTDRFSPAPQSAETYRIGWIGSPSTAPCLKPAAEALTSSPDSEVCLVGAGDAHDFPFKADHRPWSYDTEVELLRTFSVGIMPLLKTDWMRGKCALKALQYMACGVPCIATPFGAVRELIRHGENGFFADSTSEWRDAFERLRDPELRRRIGQAGRATVEARYALSGAAPRLVELLESVV
ncbi:MAG: glycosyltransferase family 4 protein [Candidatus Hydrogenedentes bacterium]|nr:glycosyltransferase family 4 protein [Candidatus Hydrogenedentota bacterium]